MKNRFHIDRLEWDARNRQLLAKHHVLPQKEEEVAALTPAVRETSEQRYHLLGPALSGRMLSMIVGLVPKQRHPCDVSSAPPASRSERRMYDDLQKEGSGR